MLTDTRTQHEYKHIAQVILTWSADDSVPYTVHVHVNYSENILFQKCVIQVKARQEHTWTRVEYVHVNFTFFL